MDNKVKLEIKTPENTTIEYDGVTIEINPFIDFSEQVLLINEYVKDFFDDIPEIVVPKTKYHVFEAECRLMYYIIQLNTNIDMSDIDNNIYVADKLWDMITEKISNYWEFRERLDEVIYEIKEQEKLDNSLGKVLSDILEKAKGFIEQIESISPDDIKAIQDTGIGLIKELENSSVLRNPSDLSALETPLIEELKKE
jgi:hypothetical protein